MYALDLLNRITDLGRKVPERPAIHDGAKSLTYGELVTETTHLSKLLKDGGVGPEDVVAVDLPRGADVIISALAIWTCGAAYLPVDSRWPQDRRDLVLARSTTHLLETEAGPDVDSPGYPQRGEMRLRVLDGAGQRSRRTEPLPRNLAYVLQTSGSTGRPNAVGVEYSSLDNYGAYIHGFLEESFPSGTDGPRVLLSANFCFDASLRPLLMLSAGAEIHVTPEIEDSSWHDLNEIIRARGITVLSGVPSWYTGLLSGGLSVRDSELRLTFVGGEPVSSGLIRELSAGNCTAVVQYGPTETTIAATGAVLTGDGFSEPPIGSELPRVHVTVSQNDDPSAGVLPGERGHLLIGGPGVGRGYLDDPRLTAERFLPDPLGPPGSRVFRSGDIGRALPSGDYSFLGREDGQVKIAGHRIELGEVSSVLNRHPGVLQAAVFVHREGTHPRLAACYVTEDGDLNPQVLSDHLAKELPRYMVPALIQQVEELPLTPRGKTDVEALSQQLRGEPDSTTDEDTALDETERRLLVIAQDILGTHCSPNDDFFELGGASLDALNLLAQVREEFGVRIKLRDFFTGQTMRHLGNLIKGQI